MVFLRMCSRSAPAFEGTQARVDWLPFTKDTWTRLTREFHVPLEIKRSILRDRTCFSSLRQHDIETGRLKMAFTARMATSLADDLAMSTTHIPSTGSTFAIFYGCMEKQMKDIKQRIESAGEQVQHPLLTSDIFAELERNRLVEAVENILDNFFLQSDDLETTQWDPDTGMDAQKTHNYLSLCLKSRQLIGHIGTVKRQLSKLVAEIDEVTEQSKSLSPLDQREGDSERQQTVAHVGRKMKKRLEDIIREYDDKLDECNMVISNTSLAMQTVWNHIARQDSAVNPEISKGNIVIARDTRHESAQMRTIAILTMIYLPLLSVAAIFSMDMFNWEAEDGESIVSRHIWLFAALAVGLTFLTLLAWILGTQRQRQLAKKSDKYFESLQRQTTFV
ncbi:hypothetical protein CPLU01_10761 [Colletotrichum plurivorum]|uniref:Uncharacterized protein n=1 Tax=Colletotrichum plurivorum TaxID=2175906 RepID=A0A8H6K4I0_9PEZI|nr:hypothetical protein CPLU01_10761 [Colletotrichum plurivorum]